MGKVTEKEKAKKPSLEENFEALEETLKKMEDADLPLEEAFALYEDGIKRLKSCGDELDMVEKKVKELADDGSLSDFDGEEE